MAKILKTIIAIRISKGLQALHRLPVIPWVSVIIAAVFVFQTVMPVQAADGIRKTINFQGKLVDDDGVNVADGNYSIVFTLYNDPSSGTNLWDETHATVATVDGVFQVELGTVDTTLGNVNFNSDQLYLGIKVGADSEMTPRIRFTAVPYAFNAEKLGGVTASQSATGFTMQGGTSSQSTVGFTTSGGVLTLQPGIAGGLTIQSNGANGLTLDTGGAAALNIGNTNATSLVLGSSTLTGLTLTTDGTGNNEVQLPAQSIGAAEILNDTLDFGQFAESQTLDADTTVSLNGANYIFDLTSTGEFFIRDAGNNIAQFLADGTITLGKAAAAGAMNLGIGTGADTISVGTNNTVGDTIAIGNNNASTTLELTGGDDWSVTAAGAATFASLNGAGLSDCDAASDKVLWNNATGTFSCGTEQSGSGADVQSGVTAIGDVTLAGTATALGTATVTPTNNSGDVIVRLDFSTRSLSNTDQTITAQIRSGANCSGSVLASNTASLTSASGNNGPSMFVTYLDVDAGNTAQSYTACGLTSSANGAGSTGGLITAEVIDTSPSSGGGGDVAVRDSDGTTSVSTVTTIEFGPDTTSSDEFIVTDEGSDIARIRIGNQVGLLNEAETATGVWNFSSGLGVGTATPLAALDVRGNTATTPGASVAATTNFAALVVNNSGSGDIFTGSSSGLSRFVIKQNGDVGIGTTLPTAMLDVAGAASVSGGLVLRNGGGSIQTTGKNSLTLGGGTTGDINFRPGDSSTSLFLKSNGRVGIGTDTPTEALDVAGTIEGRAFELRGDNATNVTPLWFALPAGQTARILNISRGATEGLMTLDAYGNFGLNTTEPTTTLDVRGITGHLPIATFSATTTAAGMVVDNNGTGNIFTASKSGATKFTITNSGDLRLGNYTTGGGFLYTDSTGTVVQTSAGGSGECLKSAGGGTPTWGTCGAGGGSSSWDVANGAIMPKFASTVDFLLGGVSTQSAKFAVLNVNSGVPTATISATSTGNALSLNANGSITTAQRQTLTLGGGDSGEVYSASVLRLDSSAGIKGGGLSDCDNPATAKLLWDAATSRFSCGTDQGGGEGSSMTVRESDSSPAVSAVAVLEFGPASTSTDEFIVSDEGSGIARVRAGNQLAMLNQGETITGGWTFNTASTTFTTGILTNGGINTTSNTDLALAANGTGDFVFTTDADTGVSIGSTGNTPAPLSVSGGIGNNAAFIVNQLNNGNLIAASTAGTTKFVVDNNGNVQLFGGTLSDDTDGVDINDDLDVSGAINLSSGNIAFSSTGSLALTGGTISDATDGVDINDDLDVSGAINLSTGNLAFSSTGSIALTGGTISDANDEVDINDDLAVAGTTGISLTGSGADITFTNSEQISNDTDGTITFGRNDAGVVTINARDNDATAALTINSGGAAALTLDTGGSAGLSIGTGNASSVVIGNTGSGVSLTLDSGSGGLNIADSATTKAIEIGGVDNNGADTIRISTNASSADTINIGNTNAGTTMGLIGGDDWSISTAGLATFTKFAGSGLSDCDTAATSKLLWDSTNQTFSCGTDADTIGADSQRVDTNLADTTLAGTSTLIGTGTVAVTPSRATGDVFVRLELWTKSLSNTDQTITAEIRSGSNCSGSVLDSNTALLTSANASNGPSVFVNYLSVDPGASAQTFAACALSSTASGASAGGHITAEVIDTGADYAELYNTNDSGLEAGDVVALDSSLQTGVRKTQTTYDRAILGIVATQPGMVIGGVDREGVKAVPVALMGRVPVKVSTENGSISTGDYLTSSSIPGVAMKAIKSGAVIGQAMSSYSGDGIGEVLVFTKSATYQGSIEDTIKSFGLEPQANGQDILNVLRSQDYNVASASGSEVVADRIVAGLDIIAPNVFAGTITADKLIVNEIEIPAEAWNAAFAEGGLVSIESKLNAQEARIASLETLFASASASVTPTPAASEAANLALLSNIPPVEDFEKPEITEVLNLQNLKDDTLASYAGKLAGSRLQITGAAIIEGILHVVEFITTQNLIVNDLATFLGRVVFSGDVAFEGRPTFNKDTAGIAIVKKGTNSIEVRFEKPYEAAPMVNVNLTLDEISPMPGEEIESLTKRQESLEERMFKANVRYIVTKRTTKGFTILLDKAAADDTAFSWIAVAVDNPVASKGIGDNFKALSGQYDKNAQPITSNIPTIIPTSSFEKREAEILPSPQVSIEGGPPQDGAEEGGDEL